MTDSIDTPVRTADSDLLQMHSYAKQLASVITSVSPPFTIGIYGEWGSGKTSLVNLATKELADSPVEGERVEFIPFSAWEHRTADELWHALVLRIAQQLLGPPAQVEGGWFRRLARFLSSDAVVIRPDPAPRLTYQEVEARLGRTRSISRTVTDAPHVRLQELATTVARASIAAASAAAPIVGGLRRLLGGGESAEATPPSSGAAGTQLLREVLRDVVHAAGKVRVCVFVDDLDRCLPDAALDLLEAIKLSFTDLPCVFVVAADEHLISQGLSLRYRGLTGDASLVSSAKGKEYFEKIIQLGIRVPERTYADVHRLISAQYPEWTPATDIIDAAVGRNPRRIKQYCTWLEYRHGVSHGDGVAGGPPPQGARADDERTRYDLLKKLIALRTWPDPNPGAGDSCADVLAALAEGNPTVYRSTLGALETALTGAAPRAPVVAQRDRLSAPLRRLYDAAMASRPLLALFGQEEPMLSAQDPRVVAILLRVAAVTLDGDHVLSVADSVFLRIAIEAARFIAVDARQLLQEDLARWIRLREQCPPLAAKLGQLAGRCATERAWDERLLAIERALDARGAGAAPDADAVELVAAAGDEPAARALLLQRPRFSAILHDEICAFAALPDLPPPGPQPALFTEELEARARAELGVRALLDDAPVAWTPPDGARALAATALRLLDVRIEIAERLLRVRAFAKLDALHHRWPDVARYLASDRTALNVLEAQPLEPQPLPPGLDKLWTQHKDEDAFLRLLQLKPLFCDIPPRAVNEYLQVAKAVAQPGDGEGEEHAPVPPPGLDDARLEYEDVVFAMSSLADGRYQVALEAPGEPHRRVESTIELDAARVRALADRLQPLARRPPSRQTAITRDVVVPEDEDMPSVLREVGSEIYARLFPPPLAARLVELLKSDRNLRLAWRVEPTSALTALPWEALYVPPIGPFLGLIRRYSLLRLLAGAEGEQPIPLRLPLRMLALLASPADVPQINIRHERRILEETVGGDRRLKVEFLEGTDATLARLRARLDELSPQLFHCVAHGVHNDDDRRGALILAGEDGRAVRVESEKLAPLLVNAGVRIAVLNACDTGRTSAGDAVSGIAGTMIEMGVPAVIATTRAVIDEGAIMFSRELYRAFVRGYTLESALVYARAALNAGGWDWSAYTLFARSTKLDALALGPALGPRR